ncbi:MAG: hypothetical protein E7168_01735 [Firmicutes bacterium]|nr:hypothetical protein [Bacillota bacterium]
MICQDCGYDMSSMKMSKKCPRCGKKVNSKKNNKGGNGVLVFAIILSILSIILLVVGFYLLSNPKTVMLQGITKYANHLSSLLSSTENNFTKKVVSEDKIKMDASITFESLVPDFTFEQHKLNLVYLENKLDKKSDIDLFLSNNDGDLLNLDMLLLNNKAYMSVKDITDKYYYTDFDYISLFENVHDVDSNKLIAILKDNIIEMIEDDEISKVKEVIKLDGKDRKTTKLSYKITTSMINDCLKGIFEDIKKDNDLMKELAKAGSVTEEEFFDLINEAISELSDEEIVEEESFYYNLYYYGLNNIVRQELVDDGMLIRLDSYFDVSELSLIELDEDQEEYIILFYIKTEKEDDTYKFNGILDEYKFEGNYSYTPNNSVIDLRFDLDDEQYIKLKISNLLNETNESYTSDMKLNISGFIEELDLGNGINLGVSATYTFGEKVKDIDLSTALDASLVTEEELNTILANVENHPFLSTVYEYLATVGGSEDLEYSEFEEDLMVNDTVIDYEY